MTTHDNLANTFGVDNTSHPPQIIEETPNELITYENNSNNDREEDYILARSILRNLIQKGNTCIDEITDIARQNESARGFVVAATLIKTVTETTRELYGLQKLTRELKGMDKDSDPRKKSSDSHINVEQAVFVGSTAELLAQVRPREPESKNSKED